ncbi:MULTISPECIES: cation diffusion facilitator family transporter [Actinomyces]|uniref:Cation transporter n=1 Tax=Actinomyces respiraculi TaxID=2744574 RepID=A0A7T0LMK7_9ACTO|nr:MULTISPECIES: cation diffusion facilitator family transporter [Actinomyces]QPL06118.1 cation transporter [Actinomyces respiraculi]
MSGRNGGQHPAAHAHTHTATSSITRLGIVLALTATVLIAEVVAALLSGSLALLADAGHMATDSAGLVIALGAAMLARRPASQHSTWGMRRAEVIGAALQAGMLSVVGLVVAVRALTDLVSPSPVASTPMIVMGVIGLVANAVGLLVLAGGQGESLNMRAAFLEVANDALGSVGVLVAAVVIAVTGWQQADAVASLLIVVLIVPRAVSLLRSAGSVLMELAPQDLDLSEVRRHLMGLDGVVAVHDLHAWTVAPGLPVLTAHIVITDEREAAGATGDLLCAMQSCVAEHFPVSIRHSTFQIEPAGHREPEACA